MTFLLETIRLGLANLRLHKLRSLLTALGIIFGVSAVITMVAIGEGSKQKALADIRQLGARNIILRSVKPAEQQNQRSSGGRRSVMSYGLKRAELRRIEATISPIERVVPLKQVGTRVTNLTLTSPAAVLGTIPQLREVAAVDVNKGRFIATSDLEQRAKVAVIGAEVATRLFPLDDPLQGVIRVGQQNFDVIGVLRPIGLAGGAGASLVGRDLNFDVYLPITTASAVFGDVVVRSDSGSFEATLVELSEVYLQTPEQDDVIGVADQVKLMILEQEHKKNGDVTVTVPMELLVQAERQQRMFNMLMAAIASISLLVGGIGIMNIMLASVTERTREIGIRRALGATRHHIVAQFLVETTVLSVLGGLIGIGLGLGVVATVVLFKDWFTGLAPPMVTLWSVVVSFTVAITVGILFGLYPATKAAYADPIVALRHD